MSMTKALARSINVLVKKAFNHHVIKERGSGNNLYPSRLGETTTHWTTCGVTSPGIVVPVAGDE
jgi:hypothetical protein